MHWIYFFLAGFGLPFTVYAVVRAIALARLTGAARLRAALPLAVCAG